MTMFHKERIREWVEALRSGQYQQGREVLRETDKHCCLGVACAVTNLGHWEKESSFMGSIHYYYKVEEEKDFMLLPEAVCEYYGFNRNNPIVKHNGIEMELTTANDKYRFDFNKIADLIEQTYLTPEETNGDLSSLNSNWIDNKMATKSVPTSKKPTRAGT